MKTSLTKIKIFVVIALVGISMIASDLTAQQYQFMPPDGNTNIPDNACPADGTGEIYEAVVSGRGTIDGGNIPFIRVWDITHGNMGDIQMTLTSPSGTVVDLYVNNSAETGSNMRFAYMFECDSYTMITDGTPPYGGNHKPVGSFADFNGETADGTWKINICDDATMTSGLDVGSFLDVYIGFSFASMDWGYADFSNTDESCPGAVDGILSWVDFEHDNSCLPGLLEYSIDGGATWSTSTSYDVGAGTYTVIARAGVWQATSSPQTIGVGADNAPPTLQNLPADMTVECNVLDGLTLADVQQYLNDTGVPFPNAIDDCDADPEIIWTADLTTDDLSCPEVGIYVETYYAEDVSGNRSQTETFTLTIEDNTAPTWENNVTSETITQECQGDNQTELEDIYMNNMPEAMDDCRGVTVTLDTMIIVNDGCNLIGDYFFNATDDCGNIASSQFQLHIEINDTGSPELSGVPVDAFVQCGVDPFPEIPIIGDDIIALDQCAGDISSSIDVVIDSMPGNCNIGGQEVITYTYSYSIMDGCEFTDSEVWTIKVTDTNPPQWDSLVHHIELDCSQEGQMDSLYMAHFPTARESCSSPIFDEVSNVRTDTCGGTYSRLYEFTVSDECNNQHPDTFKLYFHVSDRTAPTFNTTVSNMTIDCTDGLPNPPTITATDNCDDDYPQTIAPVINDGRDQCGAGIITYTWIAVDSCGNMNSMMQEVNVLPDLSVDLGSDVDACTGDMVTFDAGNPGASYMWSNGATTQTITVSTGGTYSVVVTGGNSCCASDMVTLNYNARPDATAQGGEIDCNNSSTQLFGNSSTSGATFSWTGPGGFTSNLQNPIVSEVGTYTLTVTAPNSCTETDDAEVTADSSVPNAMATGGIIDCNNTSVQLMGSSSSTNVTYSWTGPDNYMSNEQNPTVTEGGIYTLLVTSSNGCNGQAGAEVILDNEGPDLLGTGGTINCGNPNVILMVETDDEDATFEWSGPDNYTSDEQNPTVTEGGQYTVTATGANGCTSTTTVNVDVDNTTLVLSETHGDVLCFGELNGWIDLSIDSGTPPYDIMWSDGNTEEDLAEIGPGMYTVMVSDANDCEASLTIEIMSPMAALTGDVSTSPATVGNNDGEAEANITGGTPPYNYEWDNGDTDPTTSNLSAGPHTLIVTDANDCIISIQFDIEETTSVGDFDELTSFELFPTVTSGRVNLIATFSRPLQGTVKIYSGQGQVIEDSNFNGSSFSEQFDLADNPAGIYLVSIVTKEGIVTKKIIVQ